MSVLYRVQITSNRESGLALTLANLPHDLTVRELIGRLLILTGRPPGETGWSICHRDRLLDSKKRLGDCGFLATEIIRLEWNWFLAFAGTTDRQSHQGSSSFELTLDNSEGSEVATGVQRGEDSTEDEFESSVLDEVESEVLEVEVSDTELDNSDWDLMIDDSDCPADDESASQMVLMDDEPLLEDGGAVALEDEPMAENDDENLYALGGRTRTVVEKVVRVESQPRSASRLPVRPTVLPTRATVRYYDRMNPERVYPLLVVLSKESIQEVKKANVAQRSSEVFKTTTDLPVEVEPILPGCDCYPPRMSAYLVDGGLTAAFRVVPRVAGKVDGMRVMVRQDHQVLAEVALAAKVVPRTWVYLSAGTTAVTPALSALLKHFKIDFQSQQDQGFSLYLAAARLVFDWTAPLVLLLALATVTAALWWLCRPRTKDVFWEVKKGGPQPRLREIQTRATDNPQLELPKLLQLVADCPDYLPARLALVEFYHRAKNHREAVAEFETVLRSGTPPARHYQMASVSAAQLGETQTALRLLNHAEEHLSGESFPPVLLFNIACYLTRLKRLDAAMRYLKTAVEGGFRNASAYHADPDLHPLRDRPEFQQLLRTLR